jgi:hypothetical protein
MRVNNHTPRPSGVDRSPLHFANRPGLRQSDKILQDVSDNILSVSLETAQRPPSPGLAVNPSRSGYLHEVTMTPFARRLELAKYRPAPRPDPFPAMRGIAVGAALGSVIWGLGLWAVFSAL